LSKCVRKIVIDNAKADYDLAAKEAKKRGETLPPFSPSEVDHSHVLPGGTFIIGFSFASCAEMAQVLSRKIMKVLQADAAKVKFGGFLLRVTGFDAARHIVPLLSVWSARNESTNIWGKVGKELVLVYGDAVNNEEMGCISDRDKGLVRGFFGELSKVAEIACHTHLKVDVAKHCGAAAVKPFVQMAFATTTGAFNGLKARAPAKLLDYLASMEESKWAKSKHRTCMEGRMSSSVSGTCLCLFLRLIFACS